MVKVVQDGPWLWNAPNWFSPGQTNHNKDPNSYKTFSAPSPWMMISLVARMMREQKKYCIWSPCKVAPSLESGLAVGILAPPAHMHQPVHPNPTLGTAVGTLGTSEVEVLLYLSGHIGSTCSYAPTRVSPLGTTVGASLLAWYYSWYLGGVQLLLYLILTTTAHVHQPLYPSLVLRLVLLRYSRTKWWEVEVLLYLNEHIGSSFSDMHKPLHPSAAYTPRCTSAPMMVICRAWTSPTCLHTISYIGMLLHALDWMDSSTVSGLNPLLEHLVIHACCSVLRLRYAHESLGDAP